MIITIDDTEEFIEEDRNRSLSECGIFAYNGNCEYRQNIRHEALDRTYIISDMITSFLLSNDFIILDKELYTKVHQLDVAFNDLYQEIAGKIDDSISDQA